MVQEARFRPRELDVQALRNDLERLTADARALWESLSPDQQVVRVAPNSWSVAENLAHLTVTTQTFLPPVDAATRRSRERGATARGPFRLGLYGRALVRYVEPPPLVRLPAPKVLRPPSVTSPDGVLEGFVDGQRAIAARMANAQGLDLTAMRFGSPLASYVRMNLLEFFAVFNGHTWRHIWQAEGVARTLKGTPR
jgi:hypothetical protein